MRAAGATPCLLVNLLGGLDVRLGTGPLAMPPSRKAQALLAYLAMRPGQPHMREKLAALLWADTGDQQARNNLRHTLVLLRKAMPLITPPPLRVEGQTLALNPAVVAVDVAAFERRVAEGTPTALADAVALYRGDLLDGFSVPEAPFEEWRSAERERLRGLALDAFTRVLDHQRRAGAPEPAVQTAVRLLALDATQETVHRVLMRLYAQQGRRGAALRQYQVCRDILRRELGTEPEPETRRLYQEILQAAPGAPRAPAAPARTQRRPRGSAPVPPPIATTEAPLTGRDAELTQLEEALGEAWRRRGRVVALIGEAGIGKTRLVAELVTRAVQRGGQAVVGRAYETEQVLPFGPWVDAWRTGGLIADLAAQEAQSAWRVELARLFPELGRPAVATTAPRPEDALRLFQALAHAVAELATARPLLLVLEDLHWADEMSLRLLSFLARRVSDWPVALVVTAREEELVASPMLRQVLAELGGDRHLVELRLLPLSRAATLALIRALARDSDLAAAVERLGEELWVESAGNPFVIVETLRALQEGEAPGAHLAAPPVRLVRDMIARRLDRLTERGRHLAAVAAVIGREFDLALAQHAAGWDALEAAEAVDELVGRRVFHVVGERLDFSHDRIRRVAYDQLLPPRRQVLHRQVAEAFETVYKTHLAPHYAALAAHHRAGGDPRRAVEYLVKAGESAAQAFAFRQAITFYEQALESLGRLGAIGDPEGAQRELRLQIGLGRAIAVTRGWAARDVERPYTRARDLLQAAGETVQLVPVFHGLWQFHLIRGDLRTARELADEWLGLARRLEDPAALLGAYFAAGNTSFYLGDFAAGRAHLEQAVALHDAALRGLPVPLFEVDVGVFSRSFLSWTLWVLGYPDQALQRAHDAVVRAEAQSHPFSLAIALHYMARVHHFRREQPAAHERAEAAMRLCAQHGFAHYRAQSTIDLGWALAAQGRGGEAVALISQGLDAYRSAGSELGRSRNLVFLAEAHETAGQVPEAISAVDEALAHVRVTGERYYEAELHRLRGAFLLRLDEANQPEAEATLRRALAIARSQGAKSLELRAAVSLGRLSQRQGKRDQARETIRSTFDAFSEGFDTPDLREARGLLAELS